MLCSSQTSEHYYVSGFPPPNKIFGPISLQLRTDDLLRLPKQGAKYNFPGIILYAFSMAKMVFTNVCKPAGLVTGAIGLV